MKKKWAILGTAMMAAVAITACGSKDTTATTVAVETTAQAASDTAAPESQAGTTEAGSGTTAAEGESGSVAAGEENKAAGDTANETVNTGDEADDVSEQAEDLTAEEIKTFAGRCRRLLRTRTSKRWRISARTRCMFPSARERAPRLTIRRRLSLWMRQKCLQRAC